MGKYSVPENIRKLKPKGTMVKKLNEQYYVYEYKSVRLANGSRKTIMGVSIGKIIENKGFVPNDSFNKDEKVSSLDFGQYFFVYQTAIDIHDLLAKHFNLIESYQLYVTSLLFYVNGFLSLKNIPDYYEQSYLSHKYKSISMSTYTITNLLRSLGERDGKVLKFNDSLLESSSNEIAIDGHSMVSYSKQNDLADYGYKYHSSKQKQVNLLMAYDINNHVPLFSKFYPGSYLDKISFNDIFRSNNLDNKLLILDSGFYSNENIRIIDEKSKYIIPLSVNLKSHKIIKTKLNLNNENKFIYATSKQKTVIYFHEELIDKKRVIIFKDLNRSAVEQDDFKSKIGINEKYTEEKYNEVKDNFGTIVLQTNSDKTSEEIFKLYKCRWKIETFYDYLKNDNDFNEINSSDYYIMQGLAFVMQIVGLIHNKVLNKVKSIKYNHNDILLKARHVKINKKNSQWEIANFNKKIVDIFNAADLNLFNKDNLPT